MNRFLKYLNILIFVFASLFFWGNSIAQIEIPEKKEQQKEQVKYENLDYWYYKTIRESSLIGGECVKLYQIGSPLSSENLAIANDNSSPWATTNIHVRMIIDMGNTCVYPEKRNEGYCCRMETKVSEVSIVGLSLKALVSGAIFLGDIIEPVTSVNDPIQILNHGIPFSSKPKAISFDYKYSQGKERIESVFFASTVDGPDKGEVCVLLQKRWEDEEGNVFATRIGGARNFLSSTQGNWVNDTTITIHYGDISHLPFYDETIMGLIPEVNELYVKNSRGEMVPLTETTWDTQNETPTHLLLYFASSYEGIKYIGSPESVLWVDNIEFVY